MPNIYFDRTDHLPEVSGNALHGILQIRGRCYPETTDEFFCSLKTWVFHTIDKRIDLKIIIAIDYMNSHSVMHLKELLAEASIRSANIRIIWSFFIEDEIMKEIGETLQGIIGAKLELKEYLDY
jgi:hypothetical protein